MTPANAPGDETANEPVPLDLDEGALYVVREAVEDAILGVIGTLLLVGVALVLVWVGATVALNSPRTNPVPSAIGVAIALVGLYVAAATLEVIPPVREWF